MIIKLTDDNITLLDDFLKHAGSSLKTFRYYSKRPRTVIRNHLVTYLIMDDNIPICYGHLDREGERIWLGIAVIESHAGMGYGTKMMNELIDFAYKNNILNIHLSVDKDNSTAKHLYEKFGFKEFKQDSDVLFYHLKMESCDSL